MSRDATPTAAQPTITSRGQESESIKGSESLNAPSASPNVVGSIDGGAIERLLVRFGGLMRRAAQARGLIEQDIDEVLQDVRIRLWKSQATTENLDGLGASYLQKVAMSAAIDLIRRRTARREESLDGMADPETMPDALRVAPIDTTVPSELTHRLETALSQMVQNRRLVVQLHLEGYERHEISGMTGWTEAKVRNLLYRGLDDLRALLRNDVEETP